jgi:predicted ATP-dependent serine protease
MKVLTQSINKQFTRAAEVQIPDVYNRRFKTGKEDLDAMFGGQGFLPGMAFTLAAAPGTGKTSFLIQILELLERSGKKTAYISGEEGIEQLAFTSKRLNVTHVPLANMTDIDEICNAIIENKFDFVVLDSLPALTTSEPMNSREAEEYITTKIIQTAKQNECVIGTILHFTKTGSYKGSTLLPHSVDMNMIMTRNKEDEGLRDVEITKNRFGSSGFTSFAMHSTGFDFEAVETEKASKKKSVSKKDIVLEALDTPMTMQGLVEKTQISMAYLSTILRELGLEGKTVKSGRGAEATFMKLS